MNTIGINYYPDRVVEIAVRRGEGFLDDINSNQCFKFVALQKGQGILTINGKRELFYAPAILCLNERDTLEIIKACEVQGEVVYFSPVVINSLIDFDSVRNFDELELTIRQDCIMLSPFLNRHKDYSGIKSIDSGSMYTLVQDIEKVKNELELQNHEFWPCKSRSFLIKLLVDIETVLDKKSLIQSVLVQITSDEADEILLYLHGNYQKPLTVKAISEALHLNKNQLREKITKVTGQSVINYLNHFRMQMAAELLRESKWLISEIANEVGYGDVTNFGKGFKKAFGCSPSEYRLHDTSEL